VAQKIQTSWQSQRIETPSVLVPANADRLRGSAHKRPRHQHSPRRGGFHAPMCFEPLDSHATSPGTAIGRSGHGASTAFQHESIERPRYQVVGAGNVTDALTHQDAPRHSMASHAQRQDSALGSLFSMRWRTVSVSLRHRGCTRRHCAAPCRPLKRRWLLNAVSDKRKGS
jgi:hypothetical protein